MSKIRSADARRKFFENRRQDYAEFSKRYDIRVVDSPDGQHFHRLFVLKRYRKFAQAVARHDDYISERMPFVKLMGGVVYEPAYRGEDFTETAFSVKGAPVFRAKLYPQQEIVASATWRDPYTHAASVVVSFFADGGAQVQCLTNDAWQAWWATA